MHCVIKDFCLFISPHDVHEVRQTGTREFSTVLKDTLAQMNTYCDLTVHVTSLMLPAPYVSCISSVVQQSPHPRPVGTILSEGRPASVPAGHIKDAHTHTHIPDNDF